MSFMRRNMVMIRLTKLYYRCRKWGRKVSAGVAVRHLNLHIMAKMCSNLTKNIILPQNADTWGRKTCSKMPVKLTLRHLPTPGVAVLFQLLLLCTNTYTLFLSILRHLSVENLSAMKKFRIAQMGSQV